MTRILLLTKVEQLKHTKVVTEVVSFKKFRLISEEATTGTLFIQKKEL